MPVLRDVAKRVVSPETRHLLRTELNMVRTDGPVKSLLWNRMTAEAWVRNRINRHHYPLLDQEGGSRARKSDTVFVFGSGYSVNDISPAGWAHIASHDVFGFNASYHQQWVDVGFHLLRGGLYGELRWRGYAMEVANRIATHPRYRNTIFVMQEEFLAQFTNQLIGYRLFPPVSGLIRYATSRADGHLPTPAIRDGLRHIGGTLSDVVNGAYCLGWRHIVLIGVDLYDSRFFWLPPDQTMTVDRATATVTAATVNALGGNRYDEPHYTVRNGVVDLMREWCEHFAARGVRLSVYNPKSLLAGAVPVYDGGPR